MVDPARPAEHQYANSVVGSGVRGSQERNRRDRARARPKASILVALSVAGIALSGCGGLGTAGQLSRLRALAQSCPKEPLSAYVALDARGFLRGAGTTRARLAAIERLASEVAVCGGGRLAVVAFGPSPAATAIVFDDDLHPQGATENSRLLRVGNFVGSALERVRRAIPRVYARLTSRGADPVAQLQLARDFADQLPSGAALEVVIETTGPPALFAPNVTPADVAMLARSTRVPTLAHATVVFAGVGRTGAGAPPSTRTIEMVRGYLMAVCRKTAAATCRTTTSIAVGSTP